MLSSSNEALRINRASLSRWIPKQSFRNIGLKLRIHDINFGEVSPSSNISAVILADKVEIGGIESMGEKKMPAMEYRFLWIGQVTADDLDKMPSEDGGKDR